MFTQYKKSGKLPLRRMMTKNNPPGLMTLGQIAERLGVGQNSVRTYHARAGANRRDGVSTSGDLPAPDFIAGRSPLWKTETIEAWINLRPGRGVKGV
jgi:hypothetical protein